MNERLSKVSLKALFFSSIVNPGTRFVNAICYALVALVGAYRVIGGYITIGNLSTLLAYATQYTKPFNEISGVVTELQNAFACASRAFELLYEDNESDLEIGDNVRYEGMVSGDISVSKVDFSYVPDKPLIEDFNIDVAKGERIAIVGFRRLGLYGIGIGGYGSDGIIISTTHQGHTTCQGQCYAHGLPNILLHFP